MSIRSGEVDAGNHDTERSAEVVVVGSGVAGLAAAWALHRAGVDVMLLEADGRHFGGHAWTLELPVEGQVVAVDVGFIVYNEWTYPNLVEWLQALGVRTEPSDMSFAVSLRSASEAKDEAAVEVEWSSDSLRTLFAQRRNWWRADFHRMLRDLWRFHRGAPRFLDECERRRQTGATEPTISLKAFLEQGRYSVAFRQWYLLPMVASVWSASMDEALSFPAESVLRFFQNHGFLQIRGRPQWRTVSGRSRTYVERVITALNGPAGTAMLPAKQRAWLGRRVQRVRERAAGHVELEMADGTTVRAAQVVLATHADEALRILGSHARPHERQVLSALPYAVNEVYVHRDATLMPQRRCTWSAWNFVACDDAIVADKVQVTYYLNRLQNLPAGTPDLFETLNPRTPPAPDKVLAHFTMAHPLLTQEAVQAQQQLRTDARFLQHADGMYFAGAYCGYGFHEDAVRAGLEAARRLLPVETPWPLATTTAAAPAERRTARLAQPPARFTVYGTLGKLVRQRVLTFFRDTFRIGHLVLVMPDGTELTLRTSDADAAAAQNHQQWLRAYGIEPRPVRVFVRRPDFFWRVASAADIGFAEAYIAGDCDVGWMVTAGGHVHNTAGVELTRLFKLLIANRDAGCVQLQRLGWSSRIGTWLNDVMHLVFRQNTLVGSQRNITAHYDLSNELFATFLGHTWMYSCALWSRPEMTLEEAQEAKIDSVLGKLRLRPGCRVLEIGCGWGTLAVRIAQRCADCRVLGITLSGEQLSFARKQAELAGVADRVEFRLQDYRTLPPARRMPVRQAAANAGGDVHDVAGRAEHTTDFGLFDRIVSIEMLEAVGHAFLGEFFAVCDRVLAPHGLMVLQVITTPEARYEVYRKSSDFINKHIFPGSCCPSLHALNSACAAAAPGLSMVHIEDIGVHYAPTLAEWQRRLLCNSARVRQLGFSEPFERKFVYYLSYCEAGFATRTLGDLQIVLSRPGNVETLGGEPAVHVLEQYRRQDLGGETAEE
ncbi:hypothetical protein CDCA_CDCA05G1706 [Cyanidium caldarium]|uniref:Amine oxidase n=1 Tax=Cyanidium caldarium TaxID=2771 RepID=A0AAV9IU93_CYACA|nr:hypothetical protein CDCA_CDCA05G1706 [Cyanidium caldarium]